MSAREIVVLTDVSLITCVVQRGMADELVKAAQEEGAQGATIYFGRGSGVRGRDGWDLPRRSSCLNFLYRGECRNGQFC